LISGSKEFVSASEIQKGDQIKNKAKILISSYFSRKRDTNKLILSSADIQKKVPPMTASDIRLRNKISQIVNNT